MSNWFCCRLRHRQVRSLTFQVHIKLLEIGPFCKILCMEEKRLLSFFCRLLMWNVDSPVDVDKSHFSSDFMIRLFPQLHI